MKDLDLTPIVLMTIVIIAILAVLWLIVDVAHTESSALESVKSGERTLYCELQSGPAVISPEKVHKYSSGVWYFYNGSASSCFLSDK